jgi:hypothetical protein
MLQKILHIAYILKMMLAKSNSKWHKSRGPVISDRMVLKVQCPCAFVMVPILQQRVDLVIGRRPTPSRSTISTVWQQCLIRTWWWWHLGGMQNTKRTTPGIPTWSPTVVLTWPDHA